MLVDAIKDTLLYLRSNPTFVLSAAVNAGRFQLSVPMATLRWLIDRRPRGKGPERIDLQAAPPGFATELTIDLYGNKIEVASHLRIHSVEANRDQLRIGIELSNLKVNAPVGSPAALLLGAFDLSRPASLLKMVPEAHRKLIDVDGEVIYIDLMRLKPVNKNRQFKRALATVTRLFSIDEIRTENDLLVIGLGAPTEGIGRRLLRRRN